MMALLGAIKGAQVLAAGVELFAPAHRNVQLIAR